MHFLLFNSNRSKEETQRVLEDKDAELNMKDEEFKINDTAHCQVEEKLNEHIAAAEQELGFAQEQHDKLVAELEQTRAQHTMDLDAQETRLQGEISKLHDKLNEAAAQSESQRKSIKELQEMLILQKKRYAEEHAELTAKLASNDLSGKLAAAQQSCLLMQQQVEVSTKQLDQAAAVEQPLVAQVTAEIEAVWTALQEQSTLLQQQQEQQRASARQAAALVEQTQAECSRLETERQAAEFAATEARGRNTELEASLAAMSCDLSMWQKRTEAITEEREDLQMRLNAANEHADELMSQCNKLDSELQVMRDAFDMSTARGQAAESDNAALQERIVAAEQTIASLRSELSSTQNALTEEQQKCSSLSAELEEVQADREHIQQLHAGECDAHAETQSALEDAQRSGDATMAQLQRAQAQITELEGVCAELKQQLSESQSEASAQRTRAEEAEQACEAQVMLVDRVKGERDEARSSAEMDRQVAEEMQACMQADLDHALADARDLSTRLSEETTLLQAARTACECEKAEKERALEQNLAECVRNEETNQLLTECTEQLTALRAEHMTLQEDSKNAADAAAQLQEQLNADNAALSDALVRANEVSASLQHVLDETNAELHAATESLSVARAEASDLNELRTTLETDLAAVRAELSHTRTKLKVTAETCASVQVERDEALAQLVDQEAAKRSLKESADSRHDAAQRTIERLEDSVRELREECAGLEGQLTASEQARKKLLHECGNLGVVRADAADAVVALERAQRAAAVAEERHARALKEVQERAAAEVQSMSAALTECKAAAERELRAAHQEQTRLHAALVREQDEHAATLERTPTICVDHNVAVSGSTATVGEQAELSLLRQEVAALRVSTRRSESELAAAQEALAEAKERLRAEVKALNATVFVAQKERDDAMKAKTKAAAEVEQLRAKYEAKKAEDAHLRNKVYTWAMTRLKSIHFVTDAEAAAGTPINDAASVSVEELVKLCVGYLKAGAPEVGDIPRVQAKIDRVVHQCAEREKQQKAAAPAPAAPAPVQAPFEAEPVKMAVVKMVLPSASAAGAAGHTAAAPLKRVSLLPSASAPIKFNLSALDSVPETSTAAPVAAQAAAAPSAASRRMSMSMQSAMERRQSLAGALANLHANNQQ
jgi:chromosome segregation ATPase